MWPRPCPFYNPLYRAHSHHETHKIVSVALGLPAQRSVTLYAKAWPPYLPRNPTIRPPKVRTPPQVPQTSKTPTIAQHLQDHERPHQLVRDVYVTCPSLLPKLRLSDYDHEDVSTGLSVVSPLSELRLEHVAWQGRAIRPEGMVYAIDADYESAEVTLPTAIGTPERPEVGHVVQEAV